MSSTVNQRVELWMKMPGFTALNGAGSPRSPTDDTAGTIEVRLPPSAHDEREYNLSGASPLTAEPRTMPDISVATRRERDIWGNSPLDRSPYRSPATAYPNLENPVENSQKRKRSLSVEELPHSQHAVHHHHHQRGESDLSRVLTATETAAAAIAAASAASRDRDAERPRASVEPRDPYDLPRSRDYGSRPYGDEQLEHHREQQQREQHHADLWYSRASRDDRHSASAYDNAGYPHQRSGSIQSPADEHSGNDSHQREKSTARASASPQSEYAGRTPDEEDQQTGYGTPYSPSQQRKGGSSIQQTDPKRRKRNFSNRTKTGCLTCRKRKKKCDETKPECSNCVRGGFICAGYPPQKGQWGKPDLSKPTVQIESKDPTYVPPGAYGMPGVLNGGTFQQQRRESLPPYRGQALRIEPPQGRLLQTDDDRPTASTLPSALTSADSQNKLSALSAFSAPANVFPTPVSAATTVPFMDRTPKEYQRVPPLHDLSRTTEPETPQHSTPLPQINIHRSGSPPHQQPSPQPHPLQHPHQSAQQQQQQQQPPPQQHPHSQPQPQPQHPHHRQHSQSEQAHPPHQAHQLHQHEHPPHPQHPHQPHHQVHQNQSPQQFQHQHQHQHQLPPQHQQQQQVHHQHSRHQQQHQEPSPVERQPHFPQHRPYSPPPQPPHQPQEPEAGDETGETRPRPRRNVPFFNTIPGSRRERDEMYAGRPFFQFDKELVAERERCAAACWKFNNSMNPNIGVSLSERTRLFKEILQPRDDLQMSPIAHVGSVGEQVIVEAPFHADYGYNITIGEDVYIGRNCHISDAMPVSIGNRVYIGPNVSFYTTTLPTDHTQREGIHSAIHGRGITIGDDVFIGGNVTILAGVNIGHGTTVGAGSVVSRSLPRYTVCYGKPAVVKRGIALV